MFEQTTGFVGLDFDHIAVGPWCFSGALVSVDAVSTVCLALALYPTSITRGPTKLVKLLQRYTAPCETLQELLNIASSDSRCKLWGSLQLI